METLALTGNLICWIDVFLSNKYSQIRVDKVLSSLAFAPSTKLQGSVLEVLLFFLLINDLPNFPGTSAPCLLMTLWANAIVLSFGVPKCIQIHVGRNIDCTFSLQNNSGQRKVISGMQTIRDIKI